MGIIIKNPLQITIVWIIIIHFLEAYVPGNGSKGANINVKKRYCHNIAFGVINKVFLPLITTSLLVFSTHINVLNRNYSGARNIILNTFIDVLLLDITYYFYHRLIHRNRFLLKFHEVHHLDEKLDATTALKVHFGEVFFGTLFIIPIVIISSIHLNSILLFYLLITINGIYHHSDIRLPTSINKFLSLILVTPRWHKVHHHAIHQDTNSNFGFLFIWWDFIFCTLNKKTPKSDWIFGLKYSKDKTFFVLLKYPFTRKFLRNIK